jgi:hypothetical protein
MENKQNNQEDLIKIFEEELKEYRKNNPEEKSESESLNESNDEMNQSFLSNEENQEPEVTN